MIIQIITILSTTARSLEDETRNGERNANRNPEWWGVFSQLVKIEEIKFLGMCVRCFVLLNRVSRHKVELRFWLDLNFEEFRGTNLNWDFCLIWICNWLKSPNHSGFRFAFLSPFRVSSFRERAVPTYKYITSKQHSCVQGPLRECRSIRSGASGLP